MAGAHEKKEPAAPRRRSRPRKIRQSPVVHAASRRHDDVQERALPKTLRDYRRADRRVSAGWPAGRWSLIVVIDFRRSSAGREMIAKTVVAQFEFVLKGRGFTACKKRSEERRVG